MVIRYVTEQTFELNTNVFRRFSFRFARFYAALTSGVLILILIQLTRASQGLSIANVIIQLATFDISIF